MISLQTEMDEGLKMVYSELPDGSLSISVEKQLKSDPKIWIAEWVWRITPEEQIGAKVLDDTMGPNYLHHRF